MINTSKVIQETVVKGGYSVNIKGDNPSGGYMVSLENYEVKVPSCLPISEIKEHLDNYISKHSELLQDTKNYLGTWLSNGYFYIDISVNVHGLKEALQFGYENNQLEIYNVVAENYVTCFPLIRDRDIIVETNFYKWLQNNPYDSFIESIKKYSRSEEPFKNRNDGENHRYVYLSFMSKSR